MSRRLFSELLVGTAPPKSAVVNTFGLSKELRPRQTRTNRVSSRDGMTNLIGFRAFDTFQDVGKLEPKVARQMI